MRRIFPIILALSVLGLTLSENSSVSDIVRELLDETEKCMKPLGTTGLRIIKNQMKIGVQNSMRRARGGPPKNAAESCKKVVKKIKKEIEKGSPPAKKLNHARKCFDTLFLSECVLEVKEYYK
jgi:hypothetical protein